MVWPKPSRRLVAGHGIVPGHQEEKNMDYRLLAIPSLILFCAGACAQTATAPGASHPRLPGAEPQGHFQFADHHAPVSPWAGQLGQDAARALAIKHRAGGQTLVNYGPATPACKVDPTKPECAR